MDTMETGVQPTASPSGGHMEEQHIYVLEPFPFIIGIGNAGSAGSGVGAATSGEEDPTSSSPPLKSDVSVPTPPLNHNHFHYHHGHTTTPTAPYSPVLRASPPIVVEWHQQFDPQVTVDFSFKTAASLPGFLQPPRKGVLLTAVVRTVVREDAPPLHFTDTVVLYACDVEFFVKSAGTHPPSESDYVCFFSTRGRGGRWSQPPPEAENRLLGGAVIHDVRLHVHDLGHISLSQAAAQGMLYCYQTGRGETGANIHYSESRGEGGGGEAREVPLNEP